MSSHHGHLNGGPPLLLPDPSSLEYTAQRLILLELVVDPLAAGDRFDDLCETLSLADVDAEDAVHALAIVGLARGQRGVVLASHAALHFAHLWPVKP